MLRLNLWRGVGVERIAVFVDGSNFFFMQKDDLKTFLDPKKVLNYIKQFGEISDAYYYVGQDTQDSRQEPFYDALTHIGYSIVAKPIKHIYDPEGNVVGKKANLDVEIVLDMFNTIDNYDMAVLVSGDADFLRPMQQLKSRGKKFKIMATKRFIASELWRFAGMHFIDFTGLVEQLRKN
jgi:uncharacterized LabA/DUF88 family protein